MCKAYTKESLLNFHCFSKLSSEKLDAFWENGFIRTADKFSKVYSAGEDCNKLYFLLEGCVKVYGEDNEGKEHISGMFHPYSIFGECCLFGRKQKAYSAELIEQENVYFEIDEDFFKSVMKSDFDFNMAVMEMVGNKIAKSEERLMSFATKDARSRIVDFLKENANENGKKIGLEMLIKHNLTQQDIAVFTGTSRQTVTTVLNDLKSKNQIYLKRKSILIRDVATLN